MEPVQLYYAFRIPTFDDNGLYAGTVEEPTPDFKTAYSKADLYRKALSEALGAPEGRVRLEVVYSGISKVVRVTL